MRRIARTVRRVLASASPRKFASRNARLVPGPLFRLIGPRPVSRRDRDRHALRFGVPDGPIGSFSHYRMKAAQSHNVATLRGVSVHKSPARVHVTLAVAPCSTNTPPGSITARYSPMFTRRIVSRKVYSAVPGIVAVV